MASNIYDEMYEIRYQTTERDPNGISPKEPGSKLDLGKPDMTYLRYFPRALRAICKVCEVGATKYTRGGCLTVPDGPHRYMAAEFRHLLPIDEEETDEDTGLDHRAQTAWNALMSLELWLKEKENK